MRQRGFSAEGTTVTLDLTLIAERTMARGQRTDRTTVTGPIRIMGIAPIRMGTGGTTVVTGVTIRPITTSAAFMLPRADSVGDGKR
jgi:hypothetical protein